ncbi:ATP-binding protein [Actinoplanes sp. NPDC023801]|uniref:ATP-binding protein n=1 Tax=Actinoplanes sp. NPDC023801 TaxID=3154595 RepID=UPI0033C94419
MTGWKKRRPQGIDEEIARWVLDQPPQLRQLRIALQQAVAARAVPDPAALEELAERLILVATELAGNALRHGRPPTVVALLRADGHLILDVADNEPGAVPVTGVPRAPGTGGLGLHLAERFAEQVGWYATASDKHVWAEFALPGAGH